MLCFFNVMILIMNADCCQGRCQESDQQPTADTGPAEEFTEPTVNDGMNESAPGNVTQTNEKETSAMVRKSLWDNLSQSNIFSRYEKWTKFTPICGGACLNTRLGRCQTLC